MPAKNTKDSARANVSSKTRLIDAYIELAYEVGVANITIDKISAKAGLAFGTVRYYFNSDSRPIHDEAMERVLERSYIEVEQIFTRLRKLKSYNPVHAYAQAMFEWVRTDRAAGSFLIYFYYLSSTDLRIDYKLSAILERARQRVESLLLEAIGMGLYDRVTNANDCATAIHASVTGHGFIAMTFKTKDHFDRHLKLCLRDIDNVLTDSSIQTV